MTRRGYPILTRVALARAGAFRPPGARGDPKERGPLDTAAIVVKTQLLCLLQSRRRPLAWSKPLDGQVETVVRRRLAAGNAGENSLPEEWRLSPLADWIERSPSAPGIQFPAFAKYSGKTKGRDHVLSFEAQVSLVTTHKGLK